jgi:hypothetical protein
VGERQSSYRPLTTLPFYLNAVFTKIISGGQTGVDRAALDVALELGIPCGGWCPTGRLAEDGPLPDRYPLQETSTALYPERTRYNVRDSDATLVLTQGIPTRGTKLTIDLAIQMRKPYFVLELNENTDPDPVRKWAEQYCIHILNVAGPRETESSGVYRQATEFLQKLLR